MSSTGRKRSYRDYHHCSKNFHVHVKKIHLARSLFSSFLLLLLCRTFMLCILERRIDISRTLILTVLKTMAPQNVFGQGDFTITYIRFNGIFNTLYASTTITDVSIDSAAEYFRDRRIGLRRNIHGWSLDEKNNILFVDNSASSCESMVKPATESDFMCQKGARVMLQELDTLFTSRYDKCRSWDTVATEAGKGVLSGLSVLLSYAGNMPDRIAPPEGWDLTAVADWILTDLMTDELPVSGETTETRQAFRLVWPYCGTISSENVDGQDNDDDWELCMGYISNDDGEEDACDMEGVEAVESDTMEDEDEGIEQLQETVKKLTVIDSEPMDVS